MEELGRGAFARVYLAHQEALAGRPVALKVTLRPTREADRLARLQHTHIVPIYSVHDSPPIQVICMPYLGRQTIADLIRAYRTVRSSRGVASRNTSREIRGDQSTEVASNRTKPTRPPTQKPQSGSVPAPDAHPTLIGEPQAVLQVLLQLADGLAHAHSRGILHLDLKPANVLLADTGEPMLLDFNLSFDKSDTAREMVGGTIPYMAIEQLIDLKSHGRGELDERTDLYSLGVMAFEMLTGTVPFPAPYLADIETLIAARRAGAPSLRAFNPAITPAVDAIVRKLLASEPKDRYQSASELRNDLNRHLNNLPLAVVREPSVRERLGKWRRRNPGTLTRLFAACIVGLTLGLGGAAYMRSEANARIVAAERVRHTHTTLDQVRLDLVLPGDSATRTRGIARAGELLAAYGLPNNADWTKREDVRHLSEQERTVLSGDLGEVLILLAHARWMDLESSPETDRRTVAANILKLNRLAQDCFATDSAPRLLFQQASELALAAGEEPQPIVTAEGDRKPTARELFLEAACGMSLARYAQAIPLLERVLAEQPSHGAAHFCLAYCRQQVGQSERAIERYTEAERLLPGDPRASYQRGVIYGLQDNLEEAEKEFSRAISIDQNSAYAHRNRGFARFRLGKLEEAEADLTRALELGAPAIQIHLYRAKVRRGLGNESGADADQRASAALTPRQEADFIARGMMRLADAPGDALADFKAAAVINPRSVVALRNQIHVLADKLHKTEAALEVANTLCELSPDYAPGRIGRAVLLARLGRRAEAHAEAEKAQLLAKKDPEITYRAACVYALTSTTQKGDRDKALDLLERALKSGFRGVACIKAERDLDAIRDSKRFQEIAQALATLFQ
jgi:serine/threonine protein kinase/Flp pilus assembly protein TadD